MLTWVLDVCLFVLIWAGGYLLGGVLTTLSLAIVLRHERGARATARCCGMWRKSWLCGPQLLEWAFCSL